MKWWKPRPICDHCHRRITNNSKLVKIGNKKYHQSCAYLKENTNHRGNCK